MGTHNPGARRAPAKPDMRAGAVRNVLQAGDLIDIWVVEKPLGAGGMGSVYRCHNRTAARILAAVKVLEGSLRKYPEAEARFIREAEILFQLDHPNIVKVRNIRTDLDPPYLEMEFVEGRSLEDRLARGALDIDEAVGIMRQMADALAYLHHKGIRHRDIKPANVVVRDDGTIKVVDFGLAMENDVTRITQSGISFGTVSYAPPEWINPDQLDPALWDIYASGVVFYELLTGKVAFPVSGQGNARQQALQVMMAKQGHPALDPGDELHDGLRDLVRQMTSADPATRTQSADDVVRKLAMLSRDTAWLSPLPVTREVPKPNAPRPRAEVTLPTDPPRRSFAPWVLGLAAVAAVGLVGALALGTVAVNGLRSSATRSLRVTVDGVPDTLPVTLAWRDRPAARDGDAWRIDDLPTGPATLGWALGLDCGEACPGVGCAPWCARGEHTVVVELGVGAQDVALRLAPPAPRPVHFSVKGGAEGLPVHVQLAGQTATATAGSATMGSVAPGRYPVRVTAGDCPRECPGGQCPPGCVETKLDLTVPVGNGPVEQAVTLPTIVSTPVTAAPSPRPADGARPRPADAPRPAAAGTTSGLVTGAQFAAFLGKRPEYQRDAMIAAGRADDAYLAGWEGAAPPAGQADRLVVNVTWRAASDFCRERGARLPSPTDPPTSWNADAANPTAELRQTDEGSPAAIMFDGQRVPTGSRAVVPDAGFRCARR